jgi:uncharacterized protein YndB with AHSA1/START domain
MRPVTVARHYPQPLEIVWRELSELEHHVQWMLDAESLTFHSDQRRGVGVSFSCRTRVGPFVVTDEMVVTAWREREEIAVQHRGIVTGEGSFTLDTAADGGTLVTWREQLRFPWFLGGPIGAFVGRGLFHIIWSLNLKRLGAILASR